MVRTMATWYCPCSIELTEHALFLLAERPSGEGRNTNCRDADVYTLSQLSPDVQNTFIFYVPQTDSWLRKLVFDSGESGIERYLYYLLIGAGLFVPTLMKRVMNSDGRAAGDAREDWNRAEQQGLFMSTETRCLEVATQNIRSCIPRLLLFYILL